MKLFPAIHRISALGLAGLSRPRKEARSQRDLQTEVWACLNASFWLPSFRQRAGLAGSALPAACSPRRGFSLIELVGMLTVGVILMLAVAPSLIRQIDLLACAQEAKSLGEMCDGLREYVLSARRVPAPGTVPANVATVLGWETRQAQTNSRGYPRVFLYDPALQIGTNEVADLPYVQGRYGTPAVARVRALFISAVAGELPDIVFSPGTNAPVVFDALWEAPEAAEPPGWLWGGDWRHIQIRRVNLTPLFTEVVLNNNTFRVGRFSIDDTNAPVVLPANPWSAFYLARTGLGLHGDSGPLQVMQIVQDPVSMTNRAGYAFFPSYVYENGLWRGRLFMSPPPPRHAGHDLQAAYEIFMSGPPNVYKVGGANQSSVSWSMYLFLSNYVAWAGADFPSGGALETAVRRSQRTMSAQVGVYCNKKSTAN
jgi:type II secretory pathway pseudopilin PulG